MGARVKKIRDELGLTQTELSARAGISQGALSAIERSEKTPTVETLHDIATALGVLVSDLLEEKFCPVCGFEYAYEEGLNSIAHRKRHAKAQSIIDRYGFFWPYRVRKIETTTAYAVLTNPKATDEAHYDAAIRLFKALFSRSVLSYEFGDHPDFHTYVAMMLGSRDYTKEIPPATYQRLEAEYGKQEGIPHGGYYQRDGHDTRIDDLCARIKTLPAKYLDAIEAICALHDS